MRGALLFLAGSSLLAFSPAHAQDLVAITPAGTWTLDPATGQTGLLAPQDELQGATDGDQPGTVFSRLDTLDFLVRVDGAAGTPVVLGMLGAPVLELAFDELERRLFGTDGSALWRIPLPSGVVTPIGAFHAPLGPQPGALLALDYDPSRRVLVAADATHLWRVDPADARCTLVGAHGLPSIGDLYCDPRTGRLLATVEAPSELVELDPLTGAATHLHWLGIGPVTGLASPWIREAGSPYCSSVPNSTGNGARTFTHGIGIAALGQHAFVTEGLPPGAPVLMLAGQVPGWIGPGGGSMGPFCLLGSVAAFRDELRWADEGGRVVHDLGLGAIPTPPLPVAVQPGDLWHFQAWYRDELSGVPTSNTSLPLALEFL